MITETNVGPLDSLDAIRRFAIRLPPAQLVARGELRTQMEHQKVAVFSKEQLDAIVRDTLPPANSDHTFAVALATDQTGATVALGFTRPAKNLGTWTLEGAYQHTWAGDNRAGARLIYSK